MVHQFFWGILQTLLRNALSNICAVAGSERHGISGNQAYVFRRQATHKLAEFGSIGVPDVATLEYLIVQEKKILPQSAHRTRCTAGPGVNSITEMNGSKRVRRKVLSHGNRYLRHVRIKYCIRIPGLFKRWYSASKLKG